MYELTILSIYRKMYCSYMYYTELPYSHVLCKKFCLVLIMMN